MRSTLQHHAAIPGLLLITAACGGGDATHEIGPAQVVPGELELGVPAAERHGFRRHDHADAAAPAAPVLAWDAPEGWEPGPPRQFRIASFTAPGGVDVSLSTAGGSVLGNVNRWRGQMGQPELADPSALERRQVLGADAYIADIVGRYTAAGTAIENARMLGAVIPGQRHAVFVKMLGDADAVAAQRGAFDAFLGSLRFADRAVDGASTTGGRTAAGEVAAGEAPGGGHGDPGSDAGAERPSRPADSQPMADAAGPAKAGKLRWVVPEGWTKGGDKPMRLVNYHPGGDPKLEAYITVLQGDAGGLDENLRRWNQQAGLPPPTPAARDALPRIEVGGSDGYVHEAIGPDVGLIVVGARIGQDSLFVKLIGPPAGVETARASFLEFARSIDVP